MATAAKKTVTEIEEIAIETVVVGDDLTLVVDKDVLNDWEVLELIDEAEENPLRFPRLVKKVLGDTQYKKVKDYCRDDSGRVNPETIGEVFADVMGRLAKNS
ncbi:hypothetical protein U6G28_08775 [Actinomycetaceae bacterium MB13-C1-2]|nr:hypothetical protein U6G28_08775 [Actinomycetaceae bacterium MB13-C1-2]